MSEQTTNQISNPKPSEASIQCDSNNMAQCESQKMDPKVQKMTADICASMMIHWSAHRENWLQFAKMERDDMIHIFADRASLALSCLVKFEKLGNGIALFTACDTDSKTGLLRYYFGGQNVKQAETMLWFLLTLDMWRFNVPDLHQFCCNDFNVAKQIQDTVTNTYFPKELLQHHTWTTAKVSAVTAIRAFDAVEAFLKPALLSAYIGHSLSNALREGQASTLMSTFPCHWDAMKEAGLFDSCPEDVLQVEFLHKLFAQLTST